MWNHGLSRSKCWFQLNRQLLLGLSGQSTERVIDYNCYCNIFQYFAFKDNLFSDFLLIILI